MTGYISEEVEVVIRMCAYTRRMDHFGYKANYRYEGANSLRRDKGP